MGSVSFKDVTKIFSPGTSDQVVAVNASNLQVKDGEFLVLVGPSGCGKSTSLRMIAGLDRPTSGQIFISDRDITHLHPRARNIAMVFQDYALYPHMTVKQNLSFGLENLKYDKTEIKRRVDEAAQMLGIEELLNRQPKKLSGGQRQRVALGRAIVRNPDVFLLDEPLSNLDAKLRVQMRVELAELQRRLATTMIYVTHDQEEAMTLGHRIAVMKDGVIQQLATPEELYARPANSFVAQFIGSPPMNVLRGKISAQNGVVRFMSENEEFNFVVPEPWSARLTSYNGKSISVGIRPEDIRWADPNGQNPDGACLSIQADATEMLGPTRLVYFRAGGKLFVCALDPEIEAKPTQILHTIWPGRKLHFFDGETEQRL